METDESRGLRAEIQTLAAGTVLGLQMARGERLQCVAGRLWLTAEGYAQDKFLDAGLEFEAPGTMRVVIEALSLARYARLGVASQAAAGRPAQGQHAGSPAPGTGWLAMR